MKTRIKNLLLVLLLLGLRNVVQAQDAYSTNADGSIYTYDTNADGSANIVAYAGPPWVVTIPTNINGLTVTTIGTNAFFYCPALASVTLPAGVTNIGYGPFVDCQSLTVISLSASNLYYSVANNLLFNKTQASLIQFPGGITGSYTIPATVTNIGNYAFHACTNLGSVWMPLNR